MSRKIRIEKWEMKLAWDKVRAFQATSRVLRDEDPADLVQELILSLTREKTKRKKLTGGFIAKLYQYRLIKLVKEKQTAKREIALHTRPLEEPLPEIPHREDIDLTIDLAERVEKLPSLQKGIARLIMRGWTLKEISRKLGKSISTVKREIRKIRQILKNI